jgi:hypothetical protein
MRLKAPSTAPGRRLAAALLLATGIPACSRTAPPPPRAPRVHVDTVANDSLVAADARRDTAPADSAVERGVNDSDSVIVRPDSSAAARSVAASHRVPLPPSTPRHVLTPLADTISQYLVFFPTVESWFLAAARGKRPLLDIGRVDTDVKDPRRRAAYLDAVRALAPIQPGTRFRLRGGWGAADATVSGYDVWNGRIVATLDSLQPVDSLAHASGGWVATAERTDSSRAATVDSCVRKDTSAAQLARVADVRDSLEQVLRALPPPPLPRLVNTEHAVATQVVGCFGGARRIALAVDLRAGNNEWIREKMVLIDTTGTVQALRVDDLRFKGHDLLSALDGDEDGTDDLAARGLAQAMGGTVVLHFVAPTRLQRLAGGFAWESR